MSGTAGLLYSSQEHCFLGRFLLLHFLAKASPFGDMTAPGVMSFSLWRNEIAEITIEANSQNHVLSNIAEAIVKCAEA